MVPVDGCGWAYGEGERRLGKVDGGREMGRWDRASVVVGVRVVVAELVGVEGLGRDVSGDLRKGLCGRTVGL